jgi:hypothetical protein
MNSDVSIIWPILAFAIILFGLTIAIRYTVLWYWQIDRKTVALEKIADALERLSTK